MDLKSCQVWFQTLPLPSPPCTATATAAGASTGTAGVAVLTATVPVDIEQDVRSLLQHTLRGCLSDTAVIEIVPRTYQR